MTVRWVDQQRKNATICSDTRPDLFILVLVARDEQPPQEPVWQSVLDDADLTVGVRHVAAYTSAGRLQKTYTHTYMHTHRQYSTYGHAGLVLVQSIVHTVKGLQSWAPLATNRPLRAYASRPGSAPQASIRSWVDGSSVAIVARGV